MSVEVDGKSPEKLSEVDAQVGALTGALDRVSANLATLRARLEPVLQSEVPCTEATGTDLACLVPLARTIRDKVEHVVLIQDGIDDILTRLEL